jgi:hypothetical protein
MLLRSSRSFLWVYFCLRTPVKKCRFIFQELKFGFRTTTFILCHGYINKVVPLKRNMDKVNIIRLKDGK